MFQNNFALNIEYWGQNKKKTENIVWDVNFFRPEIFDLIEYCICKSQFQTTIKMDKSWIMKVLIALDYRLRKCKGCTAVEEVLIIQKKIVKFFGPRMFIRS